ncbi:MAG: thioredoxin domain-containing protein [Kofleriaceae bacterium]
MNRTCPTCGATNRVPARRVADEARCGRCKTALPAASSTIKIADATSFDELVREAPVPILVDFSAAWCGPCRMAAPEVARAAGQLAGRAAVVEVDIDRLPAIASRYGITSVPTFVVVRGGRVAAQKLGLARSDELLRLVAAA